MHRPPDPDKNEVIDDAMVEVLKRMTPAQTLAQTHSMWRYARQRIVAGVRWEHPDWDEPSIEREASRRMLGGRQNQDAIQQRAAVMGLLEYWDKARSRASR